MIARLVLAALVLAAAASVLRPGCPVAVLTAALSAVWLPVNNGVLEGATLLTLSEDHGVTVADLASVAGAGLAVVAVLRWRDGVAGPGRRPAGGSAESARDRVSTVCLIVIAMIMLGGVAFNVTYQ